MARKLGLDVSAEGVESEPQARALRAFGCGEAKGYYYGRQEPYERFPSRWLACEEAACAAR